MTETSQSASIEAVAGAAVDINQLPLPYLEIDAQGIIRRANHAALVLHPREQGELIGQMAFSLLAGCDREPSFASFAALMHSGGEEPPAVLRYLYDRSGRYRAYQLYRSVIRDAAGKPAGMCILGVNVSEATQALEETRRRCLWLESVLDCLHEAVIATDATGVITGANPAAEELLGWKTTELVGKTVEEGLQFRSYQAGDKSHITFAMGLTRPCNGLSTLVDRHGREVVVRIWSSPVLDKQTGSVTGIVLVFYKPGNAFPIPG